MKSVIEQRNQFAEQEGSLLSGWAIALYGDANGWDIYQVLESGFEELINPPLWQWQPDNVLFIGIYICLKGI